MYQTCITLAYLLARWKVSRLTWPWFVVLAVLGSMAFALPAAVLWPGRREERRERSDA